jgi:putative proteasome-type protease
VKGEGPRLFEIYSAGNFAEASERSPFLQIGETKYGKPILDRALSADTELDQAAKLTLLSFDATMRSNLSVGPPIDMLRYQKDSFSIDNFVTFQDDNPYLNELRADYMSGLFEVVGRIPPPPPA